MFNQYLQSEQIYDKTNLNNGPRLWFKYCIFFYLYKCTHCCQCLLLLMQFCFPCLNYIFWYVTKTAAALKNAAFSLTSPTPYHRIPHVSPFFLPSPPDQLSLSFVTRLTSGFPSAEERHWRGLTSLSAFIWLETLSRVTTITCLFGG